MAWVCQAIDEKLTPWLIYTQVSIPPGAIASATASALSVSAMVGVGVGFESAWAALWQLFVAFI
jgi:hypothetical protein